MAKTAKKTKSKPDKLKSKPDKPVVKPDKLDEAPKPYAGLECSRCGCRHFHTTHTTQKKGFIRRRKECRNCGKIINTREEIEILA